MPRGRYKRSYVGAAAGRAPKKSRFDLSDDEEYLYQETDDTDSEEEEFEEIETAEKTTEEVRAICEAHIKQTFNVIGVDIDSYFVCFKACVEKAISTGMIYATTWSNWGGSKDFNVNMARVADLYKATGKLHCPSAPAIVLAFTLLRILKVTMRANSGISCMIDIFKTLDCAASAIRNYEDNADVILTVHDAFEQPNSWPPTVLNKTAAQTQVAKVAVASRANSEKLHHGQLLLKLKALKTYEVSVLHTVTRQEAHEALQSIIEPLRIIDTPASSLFSRVTLPHLKVLPVDDKRLVLLWIRNIKPEKFAEWRKETEEDLEQYQWTEMVKCKLPETWTDHPAGTVFKRLEEWAKADPNPTRRHVIDSTCYQEMSQQIIRLERSAAEQAAANAKLLHKLDLVLAKLARSPEDGESRHSGNSLVDSNDANNPCSLEG
ncbi:hypothetical protein ACQKWADRAFT_329022 [Trichoderma austrokoningii]